MWSYQEMSKKTGFKRVINNVIIWLLWTVYEGILQRHLNVLLRGIPVFWINTDFSLSKLCKNAQLF